MARRSALRRREVLPHCIDPARNAGRAQPRIVCSLPVAVTSDPAAARVALGLSPPQNMDREARLLLAQLNMDHDRPARAREVLALGQTMEDGAPAVMDLLAFRLELQALLAEGEGEAVEARVLDWLDSSSPETATALPFVDELIERGATRAARRRACDPHPAALPHEACCSDGRVA